MAHPLISSPYGWMRYKGQTEFVDPAFYPPTKSSLGKVVPLQHICAPSRVTTDRQSVNHPSFLPSFPFPVGKTTFSEARTWNESQSDSCSWQLERYVGKEGLDSKEKLSSCRKQSVSPSRYMTSKVGYVRVRVRSPCFVHARVRGQVITASLKRMHTGARKRK